jgi:hypothetical protein
VSSGRGCGRSLWCEWRGARFHADGEAGAERARVDSPYGCHHFQWCGVDEAETTRRADTRADPPLEVVPPILAVDPDIARSGFALAHF